MKGLNHPNIGELGWGGQVWHCPMSQGWRPPHPQGLCLGLEYWGSGDYGPHGWGGPGQGWGGMCLRGKRLDGRAGIGVSRAGRG